MLNHGWLKSFGFLAGALFGSSISFADQFHYANVIVGDRAQGLGGAFAGIADDASGAVYNPAGIAFALSNDISGSANVYSVKNTTFDTRKVLNKTLKESSEGYLSPFVGGLGKLDSIFPGLVFAIAVQVSDSETIDQVDSFSSDDFYGFSGFKLERTLARKASTNRYGVAFGYRVASNFSVGLGANLVSISELKSEFYYGSIDWEDQGLEQTTSQMSSIRTYYTMKALEPTFGLQYMVDGWISLGLMYKNPVTITQNTEYDRVDGLFINATSNGQNIGTKTTEVKKTKIKNWLGNVPSELRFGTALFFSPTYLMTADISSFSASKSGTAKDMARNQVTNFSLGNEYFITPSIPIRFGLFTNYDARSKPDPSKANSSLEKIDYLGASLFFGFSQPNSQLSFGGIYQQSQGGKAQKLSFTDSDQKPHVLIADAKSSQFSLGFSVGHNF